MTKRETCPPPNVWGEVVADGFADLAVDELGEHLDACPTCQAAVESLMRGQNSSLAIAAVLRQELPPSSPVCARKLEIIRDSDPPAPEPAGDGAYAVTNPNENPHKSESINEYVHYLEKRAKAEAKREPCDRGRFSVDLWAGIFLTGAGLAILGHAFRGEGNLFFTFINEFLIAAMLVLTGIACFVFWKK